MDAKERRRRKKRRRKALLLLIFAVMILALSVCLGLIFRYKPTNERYNTRRYFGLESDNEVALIVNNELQDIAAEMREGEVYIAYNQVRDSINDRFYWDASIQKLLYVTPEGVQMYGEGEGVALEGEVVYVSLDLVAKHTPMAGNTFNSPNRVVLHTSQNSVQAAKVKGKQAIRYRGGVKSPILTEVEDSSVTILIPGDNWTKVATEDGYIGYIQNKYLEETQEKTYEIGSRDEGYTGVAGPSPVNLVWHQVTNQGQNDDLSARLAEVSGVNVISPTWFYLTGSQGDVASLASVSYVEYAHERGMQVWALVDNFTEAVDTNTILSGYDARKKIIDNLIFSAQQYGFDGVNVDFEELTEETGPAYVEFLRELSIACHNHNLVLSVDNHVPYEYNAFYGRTEQAVFADYVILMGYDEHPSVTPGEGSVASIGFVKDAIGRMRKDVPAEKLINAIPFYTRIWKEVPKTEEELAAESAQNSAEEYVPYNLQWDTLGMTGVEETLAQRGVQPVWDEETKQYYAEYDADGVPCRVWLEEEASIEEKLKVMQENGLAGVAAWKLGLEKSSIWEVISRYYQSGQ